MAAIDANIIDPEAFVRERKGHQEIDLLVQGAHCAICIQKIETAMRDFPGVSLARLNLSTGRLALAWDGPTGQSRDMVDRLEEIGFPATPYRPESGAQAVDQEEKQLLRALAVAGFATANVMLFSVSVWAGTDMSAENVAFFHWLSALIALPAVAYSGRPFFISGWKSLKARNVNMDVPISLAVLLACGLSIYETVLGHGAAYFDAAIMLLFFLLIGRFLDSRLRARAGQAARDLAALQATIAHRLLPDGTMKAAPAADIAPGDTIIIPPGERVPVDGQIIDGEGEVDASLVTGETVPQALKAGDEAWSGMVNLDRPLTMTATAASQDSLLAEIARLVEAGEQSRSRYVRYADRAARAYVPAVFAMTAVTLAGWLAVGATFHDSMMNAIAVLIITCPCAMALVVPAVQVVATGRLFKDGVLVKSGDALERLATARTAVFDKTGTLTKRRAKLLNADDISEASLETAAQLARLSRHPLSRAVAEAAGDGPVCEDFEDHAGGGLSGVVKGKPVRYGSADWLGLPPSAGDAAQEAWLVVEGETPVRFIFADTLRNDAADAVSDLKALGFEAELLSGDRKGPVKAAAQALGLDRWRAALKPQDKIARIEALKADGAYPLMVGDGINDAPALAAAHVSVSMGSAAEISRSAADLVIQGDKLSALPRAYSVARQAKSRVMENFALANIYNVVAVPLAVFGFVTPLVAALCMSISSVVVMLNALRLAR
ncbi:heavy metal translocating P-type ATPase [Hyphobacterium sp.]|uniref:heavy metal translocating P-type ATPase n=1 Tax=Hyphobacterium sp. TaxID=2004662 RepID=UPI003BAD6462